MFKLNPVDRTAIYTVMRNIVRKSAINAESNIVCPSPLPDIFFSFNTGTTIPKDVVERINVIIHGSFTNPAPVSQNPTPATRTIVNKNDRLANKIGLFLLSCPGREAANKMEKSISSPDRNIRKANPISARRSSVGSSTCTHPNTDGPINIPARISPTTTGTLRKRDKKIGTRNASNTTNNNGINLCSMNVS